MTLFDDLFKGFVTLSIIAAFSHGCSVKDMAGKAANAHKKGLSSYSDYTKMLLRSKPRSSKN